jgi:hypothetical protein
MRNADVLEFPKSRSAKKSAENRRHEKKAAAAISMVSVLIFTLFVNQWLTSRNELSLAAGQSRNVASYDTSLLLKDIKWEQDLAKKISLDKTSAITALSESPDLRDELIFGYLEGKYGMKLVNGQIQSLDFIDSQAGDKAMAISDQKAFLNKYAEATGIPYVEVSSGPSSDDTREYSLIDAKKQIIGRALFKINQEGRVQSIQFNL